VYYVLHRKLEPVDDALVKADQASVFACHYRDLHFLDSKSIACVCCNLKYSGDVARSSSTVRKFDDSLSSGVWQRSSVDEHAS